MSFKNEIKTNEMESKTRERFASDVIPAMAGVGLKPQHFNEIIETRPDVGWFEIHPENYLMAGGPMLHYLSKIRENYPLSFHSVGMSLGSFAGVDVRTEHLKKLKKLIDRFEPDLVSDHLSWSSWQQMTFNDLLPMPYNMEALHVMNENVDRVQTILGRQISIENPSSYFNLKNSDALPIEFDEIEFLVLLAQMSGSKILLDINNVYVSAQNHGWNAREYIKQVPRNLVSEIHLAGHAKQMLDGRDILIDDHGSIVCAEVWELYIFALEWLGEKPSLIEWDTNVPEWSVLKKEADLANEILFSLVDLKLATQMKTRKGE